MTGSGEFLQRSSLPRILLWAAGFFVAFAHVIVDFIPERDRAETSTIVMGTSMRDPRVVARDVHVDERKTTVAWITDSSPTILRRIDSDPQRIEHVGTIHGRMLALDPVAHGRPLRFAMYMQPYGPKALDKYFHALHALSLNPDLLIYSVNPTFDFTPWFILDNTGAPAALMPFGTLNSLKWTLLFGSPAALLQGALLQHVPVFEQRTALGESMEHVRQRLDPWNFRNAKRPAAPLSWHMMRWRATRLGLSPPYRPREEPGSQFLQKTAMRIMDTRDSGWGQQILRDLVEDLRNSRVPALIYMIPVNLDAIGEDPVVARNFEKIEQWFRKFAEKESGGNVTIISETPSRFLESLEFHDISHLTQPDEFVKYLREQIEAHVHER